MENSEYKNQAIVRETFSEILASFTPGWVTTLLTKINAVIALFTARPGNNNSEQGNSFNVNVKDGSEKVNSPTNVKGNNQNIPREVATQGNMCNVNYECTGGTSKDSATNVSGNNRFA